MPTAAWSFEPFLRLEHHRSRRGGRSPASREGRGRRGPPQKSRVHGRRQEEQRAGRGVLGGVLADQRRVGGDEGPLLTKGITRLGLWLGMPARECPRSLESSQHALEEPFVPILVAVVAHCWCG